jgi:hypothetical protein
MDSEYFHQYEKAYELWHQVWAPTLLELDGVQKLHSNEFTRHDYTAVIFDHDLPVSLICYSEVNLNSRARREDSWFNSWPVETLERFKTKTETPSLMGAWLCTHPEYRKSLGPDKTNFGQVSMEIFGKLVLDRNYEQGFGVTRNNRSVDKYAQHTGCEVVGKTMDHGCEVNLVVFRPSIVNENQKNYSQVLNYLWDNRTDYRNNSRGEKNERKLYQAA